MYMYVYIKAHTSCWVCSLLWFAAVGTYAYTVVFVVMRAQLTKNV